jgi:hypothetical protein
VPQEPVTSGLNRAVWSVDLPSHLENGASTKVFICKVSNFKQQHAQANQSPFVGSPVVGQFISWQVGAGSAEHEDSPDEYLGDQPDPGLRFINYKGPRVTKSRERRRTRSLAIQKHIHKRNEMVVEEKGKRRQQSQFLPEPDIDRLLGGDELDPFNSLPVRMSSLDSRLLHYCKSYTVSQRSSRLWSSF